MKLRAGQTAPLELQLDSADNNKYVKASVFDDQNILIAAPSLSSFGLGRYASTTTMPNVPWITVTYQVFTDAQMTQLDSSYGAAMDLFTLDESLGSGSGGGGSSSDVTGLIAADTILGTVSRDPILVGVIEDEEII